MPTNKIKIKDEDIIRMIAPDIRRAEDWAEQLSDERAECDDLYNRVKQGNEMEGFSQYVASTVFDTIEWLKPGMVDIFTHPDFFAVQMEDGERADKVKKLVRNQMFRKQDGAKTIREYLDTALKYHNGVMKVFHDETYDQESKTFPMLDERTFSALSQDQNTEVTAYDEVEEIVDGISSTHYENVKAVHKKIKFRGPRMLTLPPWEFLHTPDGTTVDECTLVCHRQQKSLDDIKRGELSGMYRKGSTKKVMDLGARSMTSPELEDEKDRLFEYDGLDYDLMEMSVDYMGDEETTPNSRYYVDEIYTRLDIDGDGMAEHVIVWKSGDVILNIEENPYGRPPFRAGCLYEVSFRFEGKPLPQMLISDQHEMTNLRRIYIDSSAESAYGTMVSDDATFLDAWAERSVGDNILMSRGTQRGQGWDVIRPDQPGESLLKGIEMCRADYERRTGVNSLNQGITAESMGKTATGTVALQNAGQQRQKLYAQVLGKTLKDVIKDFIWIYKKWPPAGPLSILGGAGGPTNIQPDDLDGESDVTVEVGVSPNDRMTKIQMLENHFQKLATVIIPAGGAGVEHLLKTEEKIGKLAGSSFDELQYNEEEANSVQQMQQQMQQMAQQMQQMQAALQGGPGPQGQIQQGQMQQPGGV